MCSFNSTVCSDAPANHLKKIDYHRVPHTTQVLQLGSLSLYFDREPSVQSIPDRARATSAYVFMCPGVSVVSDECKKAIGQINNISGSPFKIQVEQVTRPVQGLKITFLCDTKAVSVSYRFFDSIQRQKGVVFNVHDRTFLEQLGKKINPVLRTASVRSPCVVVDCGHGGIDSGAVGLYGVTEKHVCLAIGTSVARELRKQGITAFLTRDADITRALDERTSFANCCQADLLVSVHANAAGQAKACGIETFCIQPHLFRNAPSILDVQQSAQIQQFDNQTYDRGLIAAREIQQSIMQEARSIYHDAHDRGVKEAVSQGMLGVIMPAVLVEVGFVTHPHEALLLAQTAYQDTLARGISKGIAAYFAKQL
jgi:N-acetylmuramoyl-L-alanine amidase